MNVVSQFPDGWRSMWIIALFDLPTLTDAQKRSHARFRKELMGDGFLRMQYSVYYRHCQSSENAEAHIRKMSATIPPAGEVRFITITEKQFERIRVFIAGSRTEPEKPPDQIRLL